MKRNISLLLFILLCLLSVFAAADAVYTGEGMGMKGKIFADVTLDDNQSITNIEITSHKETDGIYQPAFSQVPAQIIAAQSLNVDTVTGATLSAIGLKTAVRDALTQAGCVEKYSAAPAFTPETIKYDAMQADTVVVGGGLGGLMTALKLGMAGQDVILLEKEAYVGGMVLRSGGTMTGVNNKIQVELGNAYTEDGNYDPVTKPHINAYFYHASGKAADLMLDLGVEFINVTTSTMQLAPGYGLGGGKLVKILREECEKYGVKIYYETPAIDLLNDNGTCVGVVAKPKNGEQFEIRSASVVLASGGWAANADLVKLYTPEYAGARHGTNSGSTGDAILMSEQFDVRLVNMDKGNHAFPISTKTMQYLSFVAYTGISVNTSGERFVSEGGMASPSYYDEQAKASWKQDEQKFYVILDSSHAAECLEEGLIDTLVETGAAEVYGSLEEIAEAKELENLLATVERYNGFSAKGVDEDFGRAGNGWGHLNPVATNDDTYYCIEACMGLYTSYGGIDVDLSCRVLNNEGNPVPGLYAAGEVAGNPYFRDNGRYAGGLGTSYSMGWIAAETIVSDTAK